MNHLKILIKAFFSIIVVCFIAMFFLNIVTAPSSLEIKRLLYEQADNLKSVGNIQESKRTFVDRYEFWTLIVQYQNISNLPAATVCQNIVNNNYCYKGTRNVPNKGNIFFFENENFYLRLIWSSNQIFVIEYNYKNFSDRKKGVTF